MTHPCFIPTQFASAFTGHFSHRNVSLEIKGRSRELRENSSLYMVMASHSLPRGEASAGGLSEVPLSPPQGHGL